MLDLFELERLFSNWLKVRTNYTCEVVPIFEKFEHFKKISVDIYRKDSVGNKMLLKTVSATGKNEENIWDKIFDSMFAYFMEVGRNAV